MPQVKVDVEFMFDVKGPIKGFVESIREQIRSDCNEYYQAAHDSKAQMVSVEIKKIHPPS